MKVDLFWIPAPTPGRIAIMPRPRGGDWLEDEVRAWRLAKVDVVVSLLMPDEVEDLVLAEEESLCQLHGIQYVAFPILDRDVPPSKDKVVTLVSDLAERLGKGKNIAIHCRQGIGRAALIAIGVLVLLGVDVIEATQQVSAARGCAVPETAEQKRWLVDFAKNVMRPARI